MKFYSLKSIKDNTITFNPTHLKKRSRNDLEDRMKNVSDITLGDLKAPCRDYALVSAFNGYSVLFCSGGKTKILQYNAK